MANALKGIVGSIVLFFALAPANPQSKAPVETRNAALRYWLAFADLQDPPADKALGDLLERTAAGEATWNEEKLGPILDQNEAAIWGMQRATKLPDCDWGLEYERGPRASIAYMPKARVLARLNTLEGMRLAAKGDTQKAVDTWLAGIHFSQDLAKGGTLIFSLVAKMTMLANLRALTQAAASGTLSSAQKQQIEGAVRALPETGLDWGQALWYEADTINVAVKEMTQASDPAAYYSMVSGSAAPKGLTVPTAAEVAAFRQLMARAEEAMRRPPETASEPLKQLQESAKSLHLFFRDAMPSLVRLNQARAEIQAARQKLLQSVSTT